MTYLRDFSGRAQAKRRSRRAKCRSRRCSRLL